MLPMNLYKKDKNFNSQGISPKIIQVSTFRKTPGGFFTQEPIKTTKNMDLEGVVSPVKKKKERIPGFEKKISFNNKTIPKLS